VRHKDRARVLLVVALVASASLLVTASGTSAGGTTAGVSQPTWVTVTPDSWAAFQGGGLAGVSCVATDDCTAVGSEPDGTAFRSPLVEHWNGATWSFAAVPTVASDNALTGVSCTSSDFCIAVGMAHDATPDQTLVEQWNGTTWSIVSSPNTASIQSNDLNGISCTSGADCTAVGSFFNGTVHQTLIEQWNGSAWSIVPSPNQGVGLNNALTGVSCTSSDGCIAVGTASNGTADQTLVERWNGTTWSIVSSPNTASIRNNDLNGVSCTSGVDCTAVGSASNGIVDQTLIEQWNGTAWSIVPSPNTSSTVANDLGGVSCVSSTSCQVTGTAQNAGAAALFEAWNGTTWTFAATQDAGDAGRGISCASATQCAAVGDLGSIDMLYTPGYWEVGSDGGIFSFGDAHFYGSMGGQHLNAPIVGMAATPDRKGYWEVAADGGVFSFGDAHFYGSTGSLQLNRPIVGMASTPDGRGYWLAAADGGIFAFGDASYLGSMGGVHLNEPVVATAATPDGLGYWLVAADGGIFAFGDAQFRGSMGGMPLNQPMVGMALQGSDSQYGYVEAASDGGIFNFGVPFYGSAGNIDLNAPVVAIVATPDGNGYWEVASDGGIFSFGTAVFEGSEGGEPLNAPIVGAASAGSLG